MESNPMAQIWHQSYKKPVPAPIRIASGRLGLTPQSSALANGSMKQKEALLSRNDHTELQDTFQINSIWCVYDVHSHSKAFAVISKKKLWIFLWQQV